MILGTMDAIDRWIDLLPPPFLAGFEFLKSPNVATLSEGKHEIDGDNVFAIVAKDLGRGKPDSPLECHRDYADIQYVVSGVDVIGWHPLSQCKRPTEAFDEERDLGFFLDRPTTWITLPTRHFVVFFPEDAHAPLASTGPVHKVVVKVRCPR